MTVLHSAPATAWDRNEELCIVVRASLLNLAAADYASKAGP